MAPIVKTPEMEQFETAFVEKCQKHFSKLSENTKAACIAVINSRNTEDARTTSIKTIDDTLKTQTTKLNNLAQTVSDNKQIADARVFVTEWLDRWQTYATVVHAGITIASAEYDLILQSRAEKSIAFGIIMEIAVSMLPELRLVNFAFSRLAKAVSKPPVISIGIGQIGVHAPNVAADAAKKTLELLDRRSKDIVNAIRGGYSANSSLNSASKDLLAAYSAKNAVFKEMLGNVVSQLIQVTNLATYFYTYLEAPTDPDPKSKISKMMLENNLPLDRTPIGPKLIELLSSQILYDMLRKYVQTYVTATKNIYASRGYNFEGIDEAQRDMIYERFGLWTQRLIPTTQRPWIVSDESMTREWNVPTKQFIVPRMG